MVDDSDLDRLRKLPAPPVDADAKARALATAMNTFKENAFKESTFKESALNEAGIQKKSAAPQGTALRPRLISRAIELWSEIMSNRRYAMQALVAILVLPVAGYAAWSIVGSRHRGDPPIIMADIAPANVPDRLAQLSESVKSPPPEPIRPSEPMRPSNKSEVGGPPSNLAPSTDQASTPSYQPPPPPPAVVAEAPVTARGHLAASEASDRVARGRVAAPRDKYPWAASESIAQRRAAPMGGLAPSAVAQKPAQPSAGGVFQTPDTSRIKSFASNPLQITKENPVSTFSADVDTASYSYVRRVLKGGALPQPDTVRVEEMINYFPYDWQGPENAETPFKSTVSIMPTPWNTGTKLMHIAIKGYDVKPAQKPQANLVFLIDVSGSMSPPDRLPLLKTAFRMLVGTLSPDDTVAIVTYAGTTRTALPPTKASDKTRILNALEALHAGGSTAGAAGIREAYRLAQESFVKGGVNRVMLATDGDFNVGQTSDADLKRLIETERKSGVFLSVIGVGQDNLNDQMMQEIAHSGNGNAAYIDTLAEAEKVLVQEASSTIFPIAKDVKIQVEFNPATVAEYRLIGYETRALKREDFNNDRVDAGEIGSGHTVTAIYEITPKGSSAQIVDDLRYGASQPTPAANSGENKSGEKNDEYAFVKIRYKAPDGDASRLITTPVTRANDVASFDAASTDQRFSVAVAAFAQKLRHADQLAGFGYGKIMDIANGAKGTDPFGYRAEFVSLVRLATALEK